MCRSLIPLAFLLTVLPLAGADAVVPLMPNAPVIDGQIHADEWHVAAGFDGFFFGKDFQRRRVQAYVGAQRETLLVAISSQLPDEGELVADVKHDSLKAVHDDSVEIYINPTPQAPDCVDYQLLVNSLGMGGYNIHVLGQGQESPSWKGDWSQAHGFHDGWWQMECAIPIASMTTAGPERTSTDGEWRINLTRNWKNPWEWSSLGGGYAHGGLSFRFTTAPLPVIRFSAESDVCHPPFTAHLTVSNPWDAPVPAQALLRLTRNVMPTLEQQWQGLLQPGTEQTLPLSVPESDPTTVYGLDLNVTSGDTPLYTRSTTWSREPEAYVWRAGVQAPPPPVDIRFAVYPYESLLRLQVDVRGLPEDATLTDVVIEVRRETDGEVVAGTTLAADAFSQGKVERDMSLDLPHGDYCLVLRAHGEGVPDGEVVKRFERHVFPWERLPSGRGTTVFPPFTPITLDKETLGTVLRQHTLGPLGLPRQIDATASNTHVSKPILAGPIHLTVGPSAAPVPLRESPFSVISAADDQVHLRGDFTAGTLRGVTNVTWDYDGTAKVELTLQSPDPISTLTLHIPVRPEVAALIHANADRIRAPVAEPIGPANGIVWDGSRVACDDVIPNFCPYVYIGDAVRGICWFGDNDKDWGWDPATPNVILVRNDDAVTLQVRLINRETDLRTPHTLTFGLLAAPVKPRLQVPGTGPNGWRYRYLRDHYTLLGTDINWLSMGTCGSFYPAGKNLWLWEMLARGNRTHLDDATIESVIQVGLPYYEPYGPELAETFRAHVRHNLRSRYGANMVFYYNRASHQACEEFETFKDEWCLTDLRSVDKGPGLGEIKVVPSESYIDYNLYWYARSFEVGNNRGVYWDNWFIAPSFNTRMTAAYRRADGAIAPSAGIWALRELAKRTFVMMNERDMLPITFPHMTSFNPLPMMSFATVQYDWEWKYSRGDIQERHSRDYLLLASTGDLAGVWPVPLADQGEQASDPWVQRTFTGVRLVHELDGYGGFGQEWDQAHQANAPLYAPIADMLDAEGLEVYRYWEHADRPQPIHSRHPEAHTIVYSVKGERAVVVVLSYAREDLAVPLEIQADALGFRPETIVFTDIEDGTVIHVPEEQLDVSCPTHDLRVFKVSGEVAP